MWQRGEPRVLCVLVVGMISQEKVGVDKSSANRNRGELTQFMTVDDAAALNDVMSGVWGRGARPSGKSRGQCRLHAPRVSMDPVRCFQKRQKQAEAGNKMEPAAPLWTSRVLSQTSRFNLWQPAAHTCPLLVAQPAEKHSCMDGGMIADWIALIGPPRRMWRCLAPNKRPWSLRACLAAAEWAILDD